MFRIVDYASLGAIMDVSALFIEGPLYPIAILMHVKILGLFTRHEQTEFKVHAKMKAITFHVDVKEIHD